MKLPAFISTPLGIVAGIFLAVLLVLGIWKGQSAWDNYLDRRYNQKTVSSQAHGDSADSFKAEAATVETQEIQPAKREFDSFKKSPAVRNNPVAVAVGEKADKVIAAHEKKDSAQAKESTQLRNQVHDLEDRGEKPTPRFVPYVDALYTWTNIERKNLPSVRVGADYRLVSFLKLKIEGGYEPPPNYSEEKKAALKALGENPNKPEFRVSAGAHITF